MGLFEMLLKEDRKRRTVQRSLASREARPWHSLARRPIVEDDSNRTDSPKFTENIPGWLI